MRQNYPHVGFSGSQFEEALRVLVPELSEQTNEKHRRICLEQLEHDLSGAKDQYDATNGTSRGSDIDALEWGIAKIKWKPSTEKMTNLIKVQQYVAQSSGHWGEILNSLIEDLKKL